VAVRQWLVNAADVPGYVAVRSTFITHKPTFMLGIISGLVRPEFLVEVEVVAAVPAGQVSEQGAG
jgi:2-iminobutanoate/2-iminopropanoate deaminase